jgi:hypothetical protein
MGEDGKPGRVSPRKNAVTRTDLTLGLAAAALITRTTKSIAHLTSVTRNKHSTPDTGQAGTEVHRRRFSAHSKHTTTRYTPGPYVRHAAYRPTPSEHTTTTTPPSLASYRTTQAAYMSADLLDVLLLLAQQRVEVLLVHDLHVRLCAQHKRQYGAALHRHRERQGIQAAKARGTRSVLCAHAMYATPPPETRTRDSPFKQFDM